MIRSGSLYVQGQAVTLALILTENVATVLGRLFLPDRPRIYLQRRLLVPVLLHLQVCFHHVHGFATDPVSNNFHLDVHLTVSD